MSALDLGRWVRSGIPSLLAAFLASFIGSERSVAQSDIVIVEANLGGTLTWTAPRDIQSFTVEWAPTLTGPWTNSWAPLVNIPNNQELGSAQVPVFYRVTGRPFPGLLLHGDGADGSTAITDTREHTVAVRGDTRITTTNAHLGTGAILFDGTGDYLDLGTSPDWGFGTGDFTVDLWANFGRAPGTMHLVGLHTSGIFTEWSFVQQGASLNFYISGLVAAGHPLNPVTGRWYHLAATRASGVLRLFVDGRLVQTAANTRDIGNTRHLTLGASDNPTLFFTGLLDEVRVVKGRAIWTQDFTPPTTPHH